MALSRALKFKRPQYANRHDKVIFQHDIARPQVAKVVKETFEARNWDVLPSEFYEEIKIANDETHFKVQFQIMFTAENDFYNLLLKKSAQFLRSRRHSR